MKTITPAGPYLQLFRQICWELDRDIATPVQQGQMPSKEVLEKWFLKWGEWDKVSEEILSCLETEDYYSHQIEDIEEEKREAEYRKDRLEDGIRDVIDELNNIKEEDTKESLEILIADAVKSLEKLI